VLARKKINLTNTTYSFGEGKDKNQKEDSFGEEKDKSH
jgi:hypothetical protein